MEVLQRSPRSAVFIPPDPVAPTTADSGGGPLDWSDHTWGNAVVQPVTEQDIASLPLNFNPQDLEYGLQYALTADMDWEFGVGDAEHITPSELDKLLSAMGDHTNTNTDTDTDTAINTNISIDTSSITYDMRPPTTLSEDFVLCAGPSEPVKEPELRAAAPDMFEKLKRHYDKSFQKVLDALENHSAKNPGIGGEQSAVLLEELRAKQEEILREQKTTLDEVRQSSHVMLDVREGVLGLKDRMADVLSRVDREPSAFDAGRLLSVGGPSRAGGSSNLPPCNGERRPSILDKVYPPRCSSTNVYAFFCYALEQGWFRKGMTGNEMTKIHRDLRLPFREYMNQKGFSIGKNHSNGVLKKFLDDTTIPQHREELQIPADHPLLDYKVGGNRPGLILGWEFVAAEES